MNIFTSSQPCTEIKDEPIAGEQARSCEKNASQSRFFHFNSSNGPLRWMLHRIAVLKLEYVPTAVDQKLFLIPIPTLI